jgi:hypothetical protein
MTATKLTPEKQEEYLEKLRQGCTFSNAAAVVGVRRQTVWSLRKKNKTFDERVKEAQRSCCAQVENALFKSAIEGNTTAQQVFLYNRCPEKWKDKRAVDISATVKKQQFETVEIVKPDGVDDAVP